MYKKWCISVTAVNAVMLMLGLIFTGPIAEAIGSSSAGKPTVIDVTELRLIDKDGKLRAGIKMQDNCPVFYLVGKDNEASSYWAQVPSGPELALINTAETARIMLSVNNDNEPSLHLWGEGNRLATALSYVKDRGAYLMLRGEQGERTAMLSETKSGLALGFFDQNKKARLMMGVSEKGLPRMILCDSQAKTVAALAVQDDAPALIMQKKPGSRLVASTLPDGQAYVSIARDNAIVWKQPADLGLPAAPVLPDDILDGLMDR